MQLVNYKKIENKNNNNFVYFAEWLLAVEK